MINNGIMFGDQGPLMEGTWYNPSTRDSFTVRDSFFEDGQYMVTTTDGRMLGYNMIQNYIKSDTPIIQQKQPTNMNSLPNEVLNEIVDDFDILPEDQVIITNPQPPRSLGNINNAPVSTIETSNVSIIAKALNKASKPSVVAEVFWEDFPKKQIEMLNEIMEIDMKEIVEWYASQLDTTEIAVAIHNSLVQYINDQLHGEPIEIKCDDLELPKVMMEDVAKDPKQKPIKKTKESKSKKTKK